MKGRIEKNEKMDCFAFDGMYVLRAAFDGFGRDAEQHEDSFERS